jgi:hypothetical protein
MMTKVCVDVSGTFGQPRHWDIDNEMTYAYPAVPKDIEDYYTDMQPEAEAEKLEDSIDMVSLHSFSLIHLVIIVVVIIIIVIVVVVVIVFVIDIDFTIRVKIVETYRNQHAPKFSKGTME